MDIDFYPYLYTKQSVPEMIFGYCNQLLKKPQQNPVVRAKAKRLLAYRKLLLDKTFFDGRIQEVFFDLYQVIDKKFPTLTYELSGRIKSLVSTINKVEETESSLMKQIRSEFIESQVSKVESEADKESTRKSIEKELDSATPNKVKREFDSFLKQYKFSSKNPFDRIRDFFAFRIIIEDEGKGDMISELYEITNIMIEFFNSKAFEVVESHRLIETGKLEVSADIIHIPERSGIKDEYKPLVKDYVLSPKKDGYQSVHFVVFDPFNERYFEVQVRTRSMNIISETLANHSVYKMKKYGRRQRSSEEEIDYSKIIAKGFRFFRYNDPITGEEKEYISDKAGITESIAIKLEFEHFLTL